MGSGLVSFEEVDLKIKKLFEWCFFVVYNGVGQCLNLRKNDFINFIVGKREFVVKVNYFKLIEVVRIER